MLSSWRITIEVERCRDGKRYRDAVYILDTANKNGGAALRFTLREKAEEIWKKIMHEIEE